MVGPKPCDVDPKDRKKRCKTLQIADTDFQLFSSSFFMLHLESFNAAALLGAFDEKSQQSRLVLDGGADDQVWEGIKWESGG